MVNFSTPLINFLVSFTIFERRRSCHLHFLSSPFLCHESSFAETKQIKTAQPAHMAICWDRKRRQHFLHFSGVCRPLAAARNRCVKWRPQIPSICSAAATASSARRRSDFCFSVEFVLGRMKRHQDPIPADGGVQSMVRSVNQRKRWQIFFTFQTEYEQHETRDLFSPVKAASRWQREIYLVRPWRDTPFTQSNAKWIDPIYKLQQPTRWHLSPSLPTKQRQ